MALWPREVIPEIRLMRWPAPAASTTGVLPFLPKYAPRDDPNACERHRQRKSQLFPAPLRFDPRITNGPINKQPYAIVPEGEQLFACAGLWENWHGKAGGESEEWIRTCAIVTGELDERIAPIHNRCQ
jgi:hypothetical protein